MILQKETVAVVAYGLEQRKKNFPELSCYFLHFALLEAKSLTQ